MPWVRSIARNEALRIAAQRSRSAQRELHDARGAARPRGSARVRRRGADAVGERAPASRSAKPDRNLLKLRYEEDLTNPEIARRLGMPEGTVKVRLHRLRVRLKAGFEQSEIA